MARVYCHQKYTLVYKHVKLRYMRTTGGWSNHPATLSHLTAFTIFFLLFSYFWASFNPAHFPTACAQPRRYLRRRKDRYRYQRTDTSC